MGIYSSLQTVGSLLPLPPGLIHDSLSCRSEHAGFNGLYVYNNSYY